MTKREIADYVRLLASGLTHVENAHITQYRLEDLAGLLYAESEREESPDDDAPDERGPDPVAEAVATLAECDWTPSPAAMDPGRAALFFVFSFKHGMASLPAAEIRCICDEKDGGSSILGPRDSRSLLGYSTETAAVLTARLNALLSGN